MIAKLISSILFSIVLLSPTLCQNDLLIEFKEITSYKYHKQPQLVIPLLENLKKEKSGIKDSIYVGICYNLGTRYFSIDSLDSAKENLFEVVNYKINGEDVTLATWQKDSDFIIDLVLWKKEAHRILSQIFLIEKEYKCSLTYLDTYRKKYFIRERYLCGNGDFLISAEISLIRTKCFIGLNEMDSLFKEVQGILFNNGFVGMGRSEEVYREIQKEVANYIIETYDVDEAINALDEIVDKTKFKKSKNNRNIIFAEMFGYDFWVSDIHYMMSPNYHLCTDEEKLKYHKYFVINTVFYLMLKEALIN